MNILTKQCLKCGQTIIKPQTESLKNWKNRHKYCSKECLYKSFIGKVAWNKGGKAPWAKHLPQQFKKGHPKPKNAFKWGKNEQHPLWKGNKVGYHGVHKWIIRKLGIPKKCNHCGTTRAKKFEWANKDHKYSRNLEDWIRLCTKCHRKYDYKFNA